MPTRSIRWPRGFSSKSTGSTPRPSASCSMADGRSTGGASFDVDARCSVSAAAPDAHRRGVTFRRDARRVAVEGLRRHGLRILKMDSTARRAEMLDSLVTVVPFAAADELRIVELGAGEGLLTDALLSRFSRATVIALESSESMRQAAAERLARFGDRARLRPFELAT